MTALAAQYRDDDVIGQPGQSLTAGELAVLVGLANGNAPAAVASATQLDALAVRDLEMSARRKLGATTQPHMIARGFVLGVLLPRALCALIAASCVTISDHNSNRHRSTSRARTPSTLARNTRSSGGRSGRTTSPASAGYRYSIQAGRFTLCA